MSASHLARIRCFCAVIFLPYGISLHPELSDSMSRVAHTVLPMDPQFGQRKEGTEQVCSVSNALVRLWFPVLGSAGLMPIKPCTACSGRIFGLLPRGKNCRCSDFERSSSKGRRGKS